MPTKNTWLPLPAYLPENGQIVFVLLLDARIFVAQVHYIGKSSLGLEQISFFIYDQMEYVSDSEISHYAPILLPSPPKISGVVDKC